MSYIVVDGLDFAGKTTLCKKLAEHYDSKLVSEPFSESDISATIRKMVREDSLPSPVATQLLIASRVELFLKYKDFMDKDNSFLISDRNFVANMVYQGFTEKEMKRIMELNVNTLKEYGFDIIPDVFIYLYVPYEEAYRRFQASKRNELNNLDKKVMKEYVYKEMQTRYHKAFELVKATYPRARVITVIPDMTFEQIVEMIDSHLAILDNSLCR